MKINIPYFLLCLLVMMSCSSNTDVSSPALAGNTSEKDKPVEIEKQIKSKGILTSDNLRIHYGDVVKGDIVEHSFILHNTGDELVELIEYDASCNCTSLEASKVDIPPQDSVAIKMLIKTDKKSPGEHKITSTVKTNGQRTFYYLSLKFNLLDNQSLAKEG